MTDVVTEMPRCCSIFIQSDRARRASPRAFTAPATWIAPPNSRSFSVSVVLPASGWEMMANVRREPAGWPERRASAPRGTAESGTIQGPSRDATGLAEGPHRVNDLLTAVVSFDLPALR